MTTIAHDIPPTKFNIAKLKKANIKAFIAKAILIPFGLLRKVNNANEYSRLAITGTMPSKPLLLKYKPKTTWLIFKIHSKILLFLSEIL